MVYEFTKQPVNLDKLTLELAGLPLSYLETEESQLICHFTRSLTSEELINLQNKINSHNHVDIQRNIELVIENSIKFGQQLITTFAAENVLMGITQENMTGVVRKNMEQVILALSTGSLYDAIAEARAIPADKKDQKYVTDARLLQFINKIEDYLQIPRSTSL